MRPDVVGHLRCPVCHQQVAAATAGTARALRCPRGHSFDIARQGYVDLTGGRVTHGGDTSGMLAARAEVLAAGHFDFLAAALAREARAAFSGDRGLVVEVGAGTGHYLSAVLDALPASIGLALDVSRAAVRRAARAHPRAAAVRADTWRRLPLADHGTALLLDVFAPRNGREFHRILRPDGTLLVATPGPAHLAELIDMLGLLTVDPDKVERVGDGLRPWFAPAGERVYTRTLWLDRAAVSALVTMGPSARHIAAAVLAQRLAAVDEPVRVTAAVRVGVYRPAQASSAG